MDNIIVELKNVHKDYRMGKITVHALDGISIKIKKGEFVALVGTSGSGKSTAMHIMGCLDVPTKGEIIFNGEPITRGYDQNKLAEIRGKKIGFIFQQFNLMGTSTALDNVLLPMIFRSEISAQKEKQRAEELLEEVGLKNRVNHKPSEMSGGEQQRIAIARALVNDPEVVFADEPTGNLDSKTGELIMNYFRKINKERGKTIVLVTHDTKLAQQADRIIKLKDGRIQ